MTEGGGAKGGRAKPLAYGLYRMVNLAGHKKEMTASILCTIVAMQIFSLPGGPIVVGDVPSHAPVQIQDTSLLRDWVFIGKPGPEGVSPRGWIMYAYLGQCPLQAPPGPPQEEGGS
jgi:hypothetical protein